MKITKSNIKKLENGYIGTMRTSVYGAPNVIDFCVKKDNIISVEARQDRGPTIFTVDEFCKAHAGRKLVIV